MSCPACGNEHKLSERPMTEKEEAVVEKAKAIIPLWSDATFSVGGPSGADFLTALAALIREARALTAPQPVRPEDVPPGTRFRFQPGEHTIPATLVGYPDGGRGYLDADMIVWAFSPDALIIPLDQEEE